MTTRQAVLTIIIIQILLGILGWVNYGYHLEALQAATRFSGRFSLLLFSLIFLFHGSKTFKIKTVLSEKYFFIFALAHGIHLLELLTYVCLSGNELIPIRLAGGFVAYLLIFLMPVVFYWYEQGKVTMKNYVWITWVYLFYVWFIFFMSYLPRVQGKLPHVGGNYSEFVVLLTWVSLMMGIKIQQLISSRTDR